MAGDRDLCVDYSKKTFDILLSAVRRMRCPFMETILLRERRSHAFLVLGQKFRLTQHEAATLLGRNSDAPINARLKQSAMDARDLLIIMQGTG